MEQHKNNLTKLCRVCGRKTRGYTYSKHSDKVKGLLMSVFNVEVDKEGVELYPENVCNCCYVKLTNYAKAKEKGMCVQIIQCIPGGLIQSHAKCV